MEINMTQDMRRAFLISRLLGEQPRYKGLQIAQDTAEQKRLLRSLFNIRMPGNISDDFLAVQDEYLQEETAAKGITDLADLSPVSDGIYLWQGDITTLRCDAIVNAANSGMTGCYAPCHGCIDNCIHTYAGIQVRACPSRQGSNMRGSVSGSIFLTLRKSTVFTICIRERSADMTHRKSGGHTGAALLQSTGIWTRRSRYMKYYSNSSRTRTIL